MESTVIQSLESVRRQIKILSVCRGIGLLLTTAAALVVGVVLLDWLLYLPAWPRLILLNLALLVLLAAGAQLVLSPALTQIPLTDLAGRLERVFPMFRDTLRSSVAFMQGDVPGSAALKDRVVRRTSEMARVIDFRHAVVGRAASNALLGGAVSVAVLLLLGLFVVPNFSRVALARLASPFDQNPWPKRQRIDVAGHVPTRIPAGQRLEVKMRLGQGDRSTLRAVVYSQIGDGPVQQQLMIRAPDGQYSAAVDTQVTEAENPQLKVWIRSGDDEKQLPPVTSVRRLAISRVEATVTPPKYVAGVPAAHVNLAAAPAVAAVGSAVQLTVAFNKPVVGDVVIEPVAGAVTPNLQPVPATDDTVRTLAWTADKSLRFHIRGRDEDGFENTAVEEYELIVRPDQPPTIQIESPRRNEERTADSVVPLLAIAEDDYGVRRVNLVVERLSDSRRWEIPLVADSVAVSADTGWGRVDSSTDRQRHRLSHNWELSSLADARLANGDVLEFFLEATDNFSLGEQTHEPVASGRLRITIISQEELTARVMDDLRLARGQIAEVDKSQTRVRTETVELADETRPKDSFDAGDRTAIERLGGQQSTAASQAKQLAGRLEAIKQRLEENRSNRPDLGELARDTAELLNRTAEGAMKDAAQQLNSAVQQSGSKDNRNNAMDRAQSAQQQANQQLQTAMDKLGDLGGLAQSIDAVRRLLAEQQKLGEELKDFGKDKRGKSPEQMSPEERAKLDEIADRQRKLADRTAAAIGEMQKQADATQKSDPQSAEAMRQAAQTGQQQQVSPNQQKAAEQAKRNQQDSAQSAQKSAELGLQQMLANLREAERRKLAELQKQLADMQKQIQNLIRRQSGHNLDNLANQGPDRLKQLDAQLLASLLAGAQRNKDPLPPVPTVAQLSTAQEQTERNTRDISRSAEALPNGADVAARLTRAAGRMERANVAIRAADLPAAYDPPQVEALAALEETKKLVDAMKREVDRKIEQDKRDAIRAVYTRIRDEEKKIAQETHRLEAAPRREGGELKRDDQMRLAQLPGEQGKLADEIKSLDERLAGLDSVVYLFANKDISAAMNQIKDMLGQKKTGKPTQIEQARVIRQLDSMIESLQENPLDSKFAQDGGGGGGAGKAQPKLPTEAELRLLKQLQAAVNDATVELAQVDPKDENGIVSTGNRQGEMRKVLGDLIEKSSGGEMSLGPEPDPREQLPEEAGIDQIENQELEKDLLAGDADADAEQKQVTRVADRMARARQRLVTNLDPGQTTQLIQKRILDDMDILIEQARKQQAQARNSENQEPGEAQAKQQPRPGEQQQPNNQGQQQQQASDAAQQSVTSAGGLGKDNNNIADIKQTLKEWGALSPRQREAVIEGSSDTVIEAYKKLVDDYYKSLATKATENK